MILHDNITGIRSSAFSGTSSLLSIDLPLNLKFIESAAFRASAIRGKLIEGTNVTALTIPAGVTFIGMEAFYDTNVTAVKMLGTYPPEGGWNMFDDGICIYVPSESLDVYTSADRWYEYPILSYEMMDMSLEFSCEFAGSRFLRSTDGRVGLQNFVDYTLNGDESMMENVSEYGIYFYNDYDGTLYLPMDTLNVSLQAYNTLEPWMYSSDPYEFIATADARMGAYVMLSNGQYIRYGQTDLKYVYDDKPSVTFYDPVCHTTAVREDSVVRYDVVDTVYLQVKGAYWMDSVEHVFCRDDGKDSYDEWSGYYDGNAWCRAYQFSYYGDAYSHTEYFIMHLTNGETITSNFYRETFDENGNMVQIISDTYPEITKSASSVQKTRKSLSRGSEGVPTREPVFVRLNQEPYLQSGDSRVGIVKK